MEAPEKVNFDVSNDIIMQLIEDQAGTLEKSVLEGVMNSVDGIDKRTGENPSFRGKGEVHINFNPDNVTIKDNGIGFRTEEEVKSVFKTFGLKHQKGDAKFGRFRIGRGQLFAQGRTTFTSNAFKMYVDYQADGDLPGFQFWKDGDHGPGVTAVVEFYDERIPRSSEYHHTVREIEKAVRYIEDVKIFLDGEQINIDPRDETWTFEDDKAYYRFSEGTGRGMDIFNQGVFVENISNYHWGVNGVIVSKEPLPLNQARNQVTRNDATWRHFSKICKADSQKQMNTKTTFDDHEITAMLHRLADHPKPEKTRWEIARSTPGYQAHQELWEAHEGAWEGVEKMRIFEDVVGKKWSLNTLRAAARANSKYDKMAAGQVAIIFSSGSNQQAVNFSRQDRAIVLSSTLLDIFRMPEEQFLKNVIGHSVYNIQEKLQVVDLTTLKEVRNSEFKVLQEAQWSKREHMIIAAFQPYMYQWGRSMKDEESGSSNRKLVIGRAPADLWTDGATYIALDRDFLKKNTTLNPGGFEKLAYKILYQHCFDCSTETGGKAKSAQTHKFTDVLLNSWEAIGWGVFKRFLQQMKQAEAKLPGAMISLIRRLNDTGETSTVMIAWKDGESAVRFPMDDMESERALDADLVSCN